MANEKKQKRSPRRDRLKPLSLYPMTPEKALSAFMRVKPKKATMGVRKVKRKEV